MKGRAGAMTAHIATATPPSVIVINANIPVNAIHATVTPPNIWIAFDNGSGSCCIHVIIELTASATPPSHIATTFTAGASIEPSAI
jgi:hypothetical protein